MSDQVVKGQLNTLATTLCIDPDRIRHLERLDADTLHALAAGMSAAIFDSLAPVFGRISKLAPIVPDALVAFVAQKVVPPLVSGMAAGALGVDHPGRIQNILTRISPQYMADAAPFLDPRVIPVVAPSMGLEVLLPAATELLRRGDYVTAANFIEHASAELIAGFATGIDNNEGLLHAAALTASADRLNEILRCFPSARVGEIIADATAGSEEFALAGISVLSRLDEDFRTEFGGILVDSADAAALMRLLTIARANEAITNVFTIARCLNDEPLARLTAMLTAEECAQLSNHAAV